MRLIKNIIAVIVALLLIMVGVLLAVNNQQLIMIDLVFFRTPEASMASWLIASFLLGAVASMLFSWVAILALKTRMLGIKRQLSTSNRELDKLRSISLNANT